MNLINYLRFDDIEPCDLLPLLNSQRIRKHLIEHEMFTLDTLTMWMNSKEAVNNSPGCRVRGIIFNGELAGWCAIQFENNQYEIAIIIDDKFWGLGKRVFRDMMRWSNELGHDEVVINFLDTRPEYKFLKQVAKSVYETEMFGRKFTSYQLAVN